MLLCGGRLLSVDVSIELATDGERTSFGLKSWVDVLIRLVHVLP